MMSEDFAPPGVEGDTIFLIWDRKAPKGQYRVICWQANPKKSWKVDFEEFSDAVQHAEKTARFRPSFNEADPVRTEVFNEKGRRLRRYPKAPMLPDHRYPISVTRLVGLLDEDRYRRGKYRRK